ncbi:prolipoprotein diacylglyceryl transferase [Candidatus Woesearchaeota archaeon]|nr:MAG: prolipoprotein diacylglyceryl transferase [Candidatus Woesearchaeota archaeon]
MFIHNINPVLFNLGPIEIRYYGLVYALAVILIYILLRKYKEELGLKKDGEIETLILIVFLGMLVGARIFHFLFSDLSIFIKDPFELLRIWHGGMSFFGGLIGSVLAGWLYVRKKKLNFWKLADIIVIPAALTLGIGRIANFANAEIVGTITTVAWCFDFGDGLCRHPYQLYAAFYHFVIFGALVYIQQLKKRINLKQGIVFASFLFLYCLFRFITDFWRDDTRWLGLTIWQGFSIIGVIIGVILLYSLFKKK